jgi:hypothetical protein
MTHLRSSILVPRSESPVSPSGTPDARDSRHLTRRGDLIDQGAEASVSP